MLKEVFQGSCPVCRGAADFSIPLCPRCLDELLELKLIHNCYNCGSPLSYEGQHCKKCLGGFCSFIDNIYADYRYISVMRKLLTSIKFNYNIRSALTLDKIIDTSMLDTEKYDAVVPVPKHFLRKFRRLRHPTDIIAEYISKTFDIKLDLSLKRKRYTSFQYKLKAHDRMENVIDAFSYFSEEKYLNILLIDDILTTGSTVNECAKIIRASGVANVDCFVLAKG